MKGCMITPGFHIVVLLKVFVIDVGTEGDTEGTCPLLLSKFMLRVPVQFRELPISACLGSP